MITENAEKHLSYHHCYPLESQHSIYPFIKVIPFYILLNTAYSRVQRGVICTTAVFQINMDPDCQGGRNLETISIADFTFSNRQYGGSYKGGVSLQKQIERLQLLWFVSQMAPYSLHSALLLWGALWTLVKSSALNREYGSIWDGCPAVRRKTSAHHYLWV
jgi:hypothetical protein